MIRFMAVMTRAPNAPVAEAGSSDGGLAQEAQSDATPGEPGAGRPDMSFV